MIDFYGHVGWMIATTDEQQMNDEWLQQQNMQLCSMNIEVKEIWILRSGFL